MKEEFEYRITNGSACVTRILTPGAVCVIPDRLEGVPVAELGDRLFSGMETEEIFLPDSLKKIGRYVFYNCEKLKILHFSDGIAETGAGLFSGCRNIQEFLVHMNGRRSSALKDFVTEFSGRLTVRCFFRHQDGSWQESARLIFPQYYDEAVENTPARIISSSIHGSGQKYRYCFDNGMLRYDRYDRLFAEEQYEESTSAAAEVALGRLMYPLELREDAKYAYERFLRENLTEVMLEKMEDSETFLWMLDRFGQKKAEAAGTFSCGLRPEELDRLIAGASERRQAGILSRLMEFRHRWFRTEKKKFEL